MTSNPLPDTPAHQVLMNVALGDHQVTNFESDVEARTIGAEAHKPILYPGRWPQTTVLWDVKKMHPLPYPGSAIYYYDIGPIRESPAGSGKFIGTNPPPYNNIPNFAGEDPHGAPRGEPGTEEKTVLGLLRRRHQGRRRLRSKGLFRRRLHRAVGPASWRRLRIGSADRPAGAPGGSHAADHPDRKGGAT